MINLATGIGELTPPGVIVECISPLWPLWTKILRVRPPSATHQIWTFRAFFAERSFIFGVCSRIEYSFLAVVCNRVNIKSRHGSFVFPLCDLKVTSKNPSNYQPLDDYDIWFANH